MPFTHPDARTLIEEVQAEYRARYGGPDGTPLDPEMFDAPQGAFFIGYLDGAPVAMGGWRFRADVTAFGRLRAAEIKRMYVGLGARRRGLARAVLAHLETTARAAGAADGLLALQREKERAVRLGELRRVHGGLVGAAVAPDVLLLHLRDQRPRLR